MLDAHDSKSSDPGGTESDQLDRIQDRFTRSAKSFAQFALTTRLTEAEQLVRLAAPAGTARALDLACGPGTLALGFAPHVVAVVGIDLTAALLAEARLAGAARGNVSWVRGNVTILPFAPHSFDLVTCGYSFHHFSDPAAVLREAVRVLRPVGRLAVVDLIAPVEPARAEANNQIERERDASHTRTLPADELVHLLESAGLRLRGRETSERTRTFDHWMAIAGWRRGDRSYARARRLLEASIAGDTAGFSPKFLPVEAGGNSRRRPDIEFVQRSLLLVAEKPA